MKTIKLNIKMGYTYVGNTSIEIPTHLLNGKTLREKYDIAFKYAQEHLSEIPVAKDAEYIIDSDTFEIDDIDFNIDEDVAFLDMYKRDIHRAVQRYYECANPKRGLNWNIDTGVKYYEYETVDDFLKDWLPTLESSTDNKECDWSTEIQFIKEFVL